MSELTENPRVKVAIGSLLSFESKPKVTMDSYFNEMHNNFLMLKALLSHEIGHGSPCFECNCPGLPLLEVECWLTVKSL